jgi:hypothetical protein
MSTAAQASPAKPRELPEFVGDLVRIGVALPITFDMDPVLAEAVKARIAVEVCTEYARSNLGVPAGFGNPSANIWRKYGDASSTASAHTRQRAEEPAVEYEMTSRQVCNVLAAIRAQDAINRYPRLPGREDPA